MFVGEKLWRLENHTMPGHTVEVTQVPGDLKPGAERGVFVS
jgi:hypothetical protein